VRIHFLNAGADTLRQDSTYRALPIPPGQ
jgi:hypothetical protein